MRLSGAVLMVCVCVYVCVSVCMCVRVCVCVCVYVRVGKVKVIVKRKGSVCGGNRGVNFHFHVFTECCQAIL